MGGEVSDTTQGTNPKGFFDLYRTLRNQLLRPHRAGFGVDELAGPDHFLTNGSVPLCLFQGAANVWSSPAGQALAPAPTAPLGFGDNPLMLTGKLLIALAVEDLLGNAAAGEILVESLRSLKSLFAFSGDFAGYPNRWDPVSSWNWSDREHPGEPWVNGPLGRRSLDFLIDQDERYQLCTPNDDWRAARTPTQEEWASWDADTHTAWHRRYWTEYAKRLRDSDPSSDEIIGLFSGLSFCHLVGSVEVQNRARAILQDLAEYLATHSYILVRPGGGFSSRGPALGLVASEWVFTRVFDRVLLDPHAARADTPTVLRAAGVWTPIEANWVEYGVAGFVASLVPGLGALLALATGLVQAITTVITSPLSTAAATSPIVLGQAAAILQNVRVTGCQLDMPATSTTVGGGAGTELALAHILRQVDPVDRLRLYFLGYASGVVSTTGFAVGFVPYLGLCALGDDDATTRATYREMLALRELRNVTGWGGFTRIGDLRQSAFGAAVALLLTADPVVPADDITVADMERALIAELSAFRAGIANWDLRLPVPTERDTDHGAAGQDRTEIADPAVEYLAALALAWLHARRRTDAGKPLVDGFPTAPSPADLAFDPPLDVRSKPPVPAATPAHPANPLAERVTIGVGPLDGVVDTGITVHTLDDVTITATGSINAGLVFSGPSGPDGWDLMTDSSTYLLAGDHVRRYGLVGRMGQFGAYFPIGAQLPRKRWYWEIPERLHLAVNTDDHQRGSGRFTVEVIRWSDTAREAAPYHAIRRADGSWQPLAAVGPQSTLPGPFSAISAAGADDPPVLQLVGISGGRLWHTQRGYTGTWQPAFGDVASQLHTDPGRFTAVDCAASDELEVELQVVGVVGGRLQLTIRSGDGTWRGFDDVAGHEQTSPGAFSDVACAAVDGWDLHVVGIVDGALLHTIRSAMPGGDATWQADFGRIATTAAGDPGPFSAVTCTAGTAGELHVLGLVNGALWHTIRHSDGSWQPFGAIDTQETNHPGPFTAISAGTTTDGTPPAVHVVAVANGRVWHTIRHSDGSWQPTYGDVDGAAGREGVAASISCAGVGDALHIVELL